jgi:hypothetical protein
MENIIVYYDDEFLRSFILKEYKIDTLEITVEACLLYLNQYLSKHGLEDSIVLKVDAPFKNKGKYKVLTATNKSSKSNFVQSFSQFNRAIRRIVHFS